MSRYLAGLLCCSGLGVCLVGCCGAQCHKSCAPPPSCQPQPPCCNGAVAPPRPATVPYQPPPSGYYQSAPPTAPPGSTGYYPSTSSGSYYQGVVLAPGANVQPFATAPIAAPGPSSPDPRVLQQQSYAAPAASPEPPSWHAATTPGVRLQSPDPLPAETAKTEVRAAPPEPATPRRDEPENRPTTTPLPVGIAHFTDIQPGRISAGFRPHPTDGIPWLQEKGYRTVLHLRAPGSNDDNDRRLIEKYGLKYISLEVSPDALTRELVDQVSAMLADTNSQPLFIYDADGSSTGAVMYLHFRLRDNVTEENARTRAVQLGLRIDDSPEGSAWSSAIRKILP